MARIRSIHPDACRSAKLAAISAEAERAYWRLQPHCDDEGRVEDEPDVLASNMFQKQREFTADMVDGWLWDLAEAGLIDRYEVDATNFLEVVRWSDYQHPQRKRDSDIPAGPRGGSRKARLRVRDGSVLPPRHVVPGVGGEGSGTGEPVANAVREPDEDHPLPVDLNNPRVAQAARHAGATVTSIHREEAS